MTVLNSMSRFHLCIEALRRTRKPVAQADQLLQECEAMLVRHHAYVREALEDLPEIRDWTLSP